MEYAEQLTRETDLLAGLVADPDLATDLDAVVPTCPGWSVGQVLKHVGRGHLWAAQMVAERSTEPADPRQVPGGKPPDDPAGTAAWLRSSAATLLRDVEAAGDAEVWTFTGPRSASWWVRRRLHEVSVHRADVALALGTAYEIAPEVAADGVDEWLGLVAGRPDLDALRPGATLAVVATDVERSWLLRGLEAGARLESDATGADASVEASAADLLLAVTRRAPERVTVTGDPGVWRGWLERTPF